MYKFVGIAGSVNPTFSSCLYLWVDIDTRELYISGDQQIVIPDTTPTQEYMLMSDLLPKKETKYSEFRSHLTNPKKITKTDYSNKTVLYHNSFWKLNL
jgi:hypothetical protein